MAKTKPKPAAKTKGKPPAEANGHVDLGDGQPQIPQLEDEKDQELINLAKDYHTEMTKRVKASAKEKDAKERVIEYMKKFNPPKKSYSYKGVIVLLDTTDTLKVKMPSEKDE